MIGTIIPIGRVYLYWATISYWNQNPMLADNLILWIQISRIRSTVFQISFSLSKIEKTKITLTSSSQNMLWASMLKTRSKNTLTIALKILLVKWISRKYQVFRQELWLPSRRNRAQRDEISCNKFKMNRIELWSMININASKKPSPKYWKMITTTTRPVAPVITLNQSSHTDLNCNLPVIERRRLIRK